MLSVAVSPSMAEVERKFAVERRKDRGRCCIAASRISGGELIVSGEGAIAAVAEPRGTVLCCQVCSTVTAALSSHE